MIFDTDVLIWCLRGYDKAANALESVDERYVSVITYMELIQGARDKAEVRQIKSFLADLQFQIQPLTENIGHRASIYMEEYALSSGIAMADALIAAAAVESDETLMTGNRKHYKAVQDLQIKVFRP